MTGNDPRHSVELFVFAIFNEVDNLDYCYDDNAYCYYCYSCCDYHKLFVLIWHLYLSFRFLFRIAQQRYIFK